MAPLWKEGPESAALNLEEIAFTSGKILTPEMVQEAISTA